TVDAEKWHADVDNNAGIASGQFDTCASDFFRTTMYGDLHLNSQNGFKEHDFPRGNHLVC
ncbi:MAG: hypothetical protein GY826_39405, partial [Fuerstiella sp.]|nr:hypothetical protein [Fuerstiella sp.]